MPSEIEQLYREHRGRLVRLVERELHDHYDAEDVVQTAFLDAQRALERGTIPRNPRAWLAAIALNAAHRLRRRRLNAAPLEDYAVQEASGMSEIRAALTDLPKEQRAAVLYRDVLGFSYGETAEQMGTSVNAVTMLLHRGRSRLREALGVTAGGFGLWRWLRQSGTPQVAAVKGAAAVVAAAGLATGGVVVAERTVRAVTPSTADTTAAVLPADSGSLTARAARTTGGAVAFDSARSPFKAVDVSGASAVPTPTQGSGGAPTPASVPLSRTDALSSLPSASSTLPVPTFSVPAVSIPALSTTVAATVTVSTPITTATVSTPTGTTATVTTPITTVTLPIP